VIKVKIMPQNPLISFEYVVQNELQNGEQNFINGVPIMTHPTVNGNVKASNRAGYQVFRPPDHNNVEIWHHGPR
jgi:hypothetical protein